MIQELTIEEIPYVDGAVQTGQSNFKWILNGERICGAANVDSNDGTLNRPAVQVNDNVKVVNNNVKESVVKINEISHAVNLINKVLGQAGSVDVIEKVNDNTQRIISLETKDTEFGVKLQETVDSINTLNTKIGHREIEDKTDRTIYDDLFYVKKELGSFAGFDINGNADLDSQGSGIKYRVGQLSAGVGSNTSRISILEQSFAASDIGALTNRVSELRDELGNTNDGTGIPVYTRLKELEAQNTNDRDAITEIKAKIAFENPKSIDTRVAEVTQQLSELNNVVLDPSTGIQTDVHNLMAEVGDSSSPGTIMHDLLEARGDIKTLTEVVGENSTSGIRAQITSIVTDIGAEDQPNSIKGQLKTQSDTTMGLGISVQSLEGRVGSGNSGLTGAVALMSSEIYGVSSSDDPLVKAGIKATVQQLSADNATHVVKPADVGTFVYTNGNWHKVTDIKVDFEHASQVTIVADQSSTIPMENSSFTIIQGCQVGGNQITFSDSGLVRITVHVELGFTGEDVANKVYSVNMVKTGTRPTMIEIDDYVTTSKGTHLYRYDRLVQITEAEQLSFQVQPKNTGSAGDVTTKVTCVIVPA